jgi:carbamoyltransferase
MSGLVLGVSAFFHDSAACLLREGRIVAAAQEERFTRIKGDARFPRQAAEYCLTSAGATASDLDAVVFYEKPLLKFERLLETYLDIAPRGFASFRRAGPLWMKDRLFADRAIRQELGNFAGRVLYAEHHESHAASAFFPSPFDDAAILTIDGVGEWATASIGIGRSNEIALLKEMHFPDSLGLLYSAFTYHAGFKVNSGEYKLMGLAPFGEPRFAQLICGELLDLREDGSMTLNQHYFDYRGGLRMTSRAFDKLFGPPRAPETAITEREMDLAASIQSVCEEVVFRMARHAREITNLPRLCMAGGVALNAVANGKLVRSGLYDQVWVQPAAGDAGGALGSAYLAWCRYFGGNRAASRSGDLMEGSFLGPEFEDDSIRGALEAAGLRFEPLGSERERTTAGLLKDGKIVGFFDGRMEFGPRALGSRSILADPRDEGMQSRINRKIKFREGFRPFAPSVLEESAVEFFDMPQSSPYMTFVFPLLERRRRPPSQPRVGLDRVRDVRSDIPAVTHLDYSARVQTVNSTQQPSFHAVLSEFGRMTGYDVLVNTSFNVRGEPIVCTPSDAITCFSATEIDALVIGPFLVARSEQPESFRRQLSPPGVVLD